MLAAPKLALVPARRYYCDITWSYHNVCAKIRLKEVQMGTHDFKYNKVPLFLLRYNLVIPQCMCQVSFRLKEAQMEAHDFKYNKVPLFLLENHGISILRCLLPRN